MSVAEMQKIQLVACENHKDSILNTLKKNEIIHLLGINKGGEPVAQFEYDLAEIKSTINFIESFQKKEKSFIESFIPSKDEIREEELSEMQQSLDLRETIAQCRQLEAKISNLKNLKSGLLLEHEKIIPWKGLDITLEELSGTKMVSFILGKIHRDRLSQLEQELTLSNIPFQLNQISQEDNLAYFAVIYLKSARQDMIDLLNKHQIEIISLPISKRTPAYEIAHIESLLKKVEQETADIIIEAQKMSRHLHKLKALYDFFLEKKQHAEAKNKLLNTTYTFVLSGWIKKSDLKRLTKIIAKITGEFGIISIEAEKDERPPVILSNPAIISPFELITKTFSIPKPNDLDPSFAFASFFVLFFGICLGDFGYGILLTAISVYFLKRYKLPQGGIHLFKLLIMGGIASIIAGILTGSYFGQSPDTLLIFPPLKNMLVSFRVIDPVKNPVAMLVFSLILGVIQILFGTLLAVISKIRNGDYLSAIIDDGFWLFMLSSIIFLIASIVLALPSARLAVYSTGFGALLLIGTQGRHQKTWPQKIISGILSLYKLSSYLGDTLSYSRLLALGMSSTIIGAVINILAFMVKDSVPVVGIIFMAMLLILGHLFNLVISVLGAFIHSMRLQMVEFFGKFYEGGGIEFKPYKRVAEYTVLK